MIENSFALTPAQFLSAYRLASAHGHFWARTLYDEAQAMRLANGSASCEGEGATLAPLTSEQVEQVLLALVGERIELDALHEFIVGSSHASEMGGQMPVEGSSLGGIEHITGSGRTRWVVGRKGSAIIEVRRLVGATRHVVGEPPLAVITLTVMPSAGDAGVRVRWFDMHARARHWQAALLCAKALGAEGAFRLAMPSRVRKAFAESDHARLVGEQNVEMARRAVAVEQARDTGSVAHCIAYTALQEAEAAMHAAAQAPLDKLDEHLGAFDRLCGRIAGSSEGGEVKS